MTRSKRVLWLLPVLAAAGLVLLLRAIGFEYVFIDGDVVFPPADPQYHLRRGVQVFERFPDVLLFDTYINHPGGASIPWPPLYDVVMGAVPKLSGAGEHGFEVFAAWLSPLCALLACVPIALVARRVSGESGPRVPALAIAIFATVPLLVNYGRVGMADHHAAVSMVGAWMLLCCVAQVDPDLTRRGALRWMAAHVVVRLAMLLTWHGSLLYLGLAEGSLALFFVVTGRRSLARHQAIGAAVTAAALVPILAVMPTPLGGAWSAIALSRLHALAMVAVAVVLAVGVVATRRASLDTIPARLGVLAAAALVFVVAVLMLPGPREGLGLAFEFLTMSDDVGHLTGEQLPIFDLGGRSAMKPFALIWSWWAPLIPLAPVGVALAARRSPAGSPARAGAWMLFVWSAVFGALAIVQRRYGNDFGPSAGVAFALGFTWLGDVLAARVASGRARHRVSTALATLLVVVTAWPALARVHGPRAQGSLAAWRGDPVVIARTHWGIAVTLARFLREVRLHTPETSGFHDDDARPEYGVIAHPNLGHAIQYEARRPTATDPFWAYIGRENWALTARFIATRNEAEALALAKRLEGRYVVTMPQLPPGSVMQRLHDRDGTAAGAAPALSHFRLILEAPAGAPALGDVFDETARRPGPPYKLFEIVPGAELVFECLPDARAHARAVVRIGTRELVWQTSALADAEGRVRMRVPYPAGVGVMATKAGAFAPKALGLRCGDRRWRVAVPEKAVREGLVVEAHPPPRTEAPPAA